MEHLSKDIEQKKKHGVHRLYHLDSLRGIAALAVAFHHTVDSFSGIPLNNGYLDALTGKSPVFFFFLLSGFVLSRSLDKETGLKKNDIISYLIRRLFRIYPAVLASLAFSILLTKIIVIPVDWSNAYWFQIYHNGVLCVHGGINYLKEFLLCNFNLNPPLWSIRVELACSFLLPFLLLLLSRFPMLLLPMGLLLALWFEKGLGFPKFLFLFYLGFIIQKYGGVVERISSRVSKLLIISFSGLWICTLFLGFDFVFHGLILSFLFTLLVPCNWVTLLKFLQSHPLRFLGRISYSFYLLHCPILYFCWSLLKYITPHFLVHQPSFVPAILLCVLSITLTIPAAIFCEIFVEQRFNKLGHRLSVLK